MSDLPATPAAPARRTIFLLALVALLPIWFFLGSHPLSPRSEGRYASTSLSMVDGQGWLIPRLEGQTHLTKPPLTYWLEAACMKIAGVNEWAARFPSALAGSLTLLVALGLGWKVGGPRVGLITMALLAVTPLELVISRLTITDAMLNLFWTSALAAGYLAIKEPTRLRWPLLLWLSVALGLMTKGPLALVPVGVILIWILLRLGSREASGSIKADIKALRLGWGLVPSAIPALVWVFAALHADPKAGFVWMHEMIDRIQGTASQNHSQSNLHIRPRWYFIPIFIAGLFPATAMLNLPGLNYPWKSAWADLRAGRDASLWALAVLLPFVMFSAIEGKLPSYIDPLAPPLALLTALMLERWITRQADDPQPRRHPPEVVKTLLICACGLLLIGPAILWGPGWLARLSAIPLPAWLPAKWALAASSSIADARDALTTFASGLTLPDILVLEAGLLLPALAAAWLCWSWKRRPAARAQALAAAWLAFVFFWLVLFNFQNTLDNKASVPATLSQLHRLIGPAPVTLVTYGFADDTLTFYNRSDAPRVTTPALADQLTAHGSTLVVIAEERAWKKLQTDSPALAAHFERVLDWKLWSKEEPRLFLRVISSP